VVLTTTSCSAVRCSIADVLGGWRSA
jgi:hypothetical protein